VLEWLAKYWLQVFFSLICAGFGVAAKYIWGQLKKEYLDALKKNQQDILDITHHLENLQNNFNQSFAEINSKMDRMQEQSEASDLAIIRDSLLRKMRYGLSEEECITMADFETVTDLFNNYEKLHGNGQVHLIYERYKKLPICHTEHNQ